MTDFRALCSELVDVLADHCGDNEFAWGLVDRAAAALAEQTPSLKEQALKALERVPGPGADSAYLRQWSRSEAASLINNVRRALEQLND